MSEEVLHATNGAIAERDGPFGDYSEGAPEDQPRRRSGTNL